MRLDPQLVMDGFVTITLLTLAVVLVVSARRREQTRYLAFFLFLVAFNFAAVAFQRVLPSDRAALASLMVLALDPLFLLLFVTSYPYDQRGTGTWTLIGLAGFTALTAMGWALVDPGGGLSGLSIGRGIHPRQAPFWLVIGNLFVVYTLAWFLSLRAILQAPTDGLARRSSWISMAVGVVVLPRLGSALLDAGPRLIIRDVTEGIVTLLSYAGVMSLTAAVAVGAGVAYCMHQRTQHTGRATRSALLAAALTGGLIVTVTGIRVLNELGVFLPSESATYGLRWIVFAGLIGYGILVGDAMETTTAHRRVVPAFTGTTMGFLASIASWLALAGMTLTLPGKLALTVGTGVGIGLSTALVTKRLLRRYAPRSSPGSNDDRRFGMYQAALEDAWKHGPPGSAARRRLERDRRRYRLSQEEADVLEHVVRAETGPGVAPLAIGEEPIPGLVIEELLGEGTAGRAYRAYDHARSKAVVVKEIRLEALGSEMARQRLITEFRTLSGVDHPNIIPVLDVELVGGRYLLLREYAEGRTLAELVERGPLSAEQVLGLATDILSGLQAIHEAGVTHRDLKPENVVVGDHGRARIFDMDVADVTLDGPKAGATANTFAASGVSGTLTYMAPEQAQGRAVDGRTDLFALGLLLAEALTGRRRRALQGLSLYQALEAVIRAPVELDDIPEPWRTVLAPAVALDPRERYRSADQMLGALVAPCP